MHNYGKIFTNITDLLISPDSNFIFISSIIHPPNSNLTTPSDSKLITSKNQICRPSFTMPKKLYFKQTPNSGGALKQFSISQKILIKDFGIIHSAPITSMSITPDSMFLFTCSEKGELLQYFVQTSIIKRNYGNIDQLYILSTLITSNSKYLFTSDCLGNLQQFSINQEKMVQNFGNIHNNSAILCMASTKDSKYLFTAGAKGILKQWDVSEPTTAPKLIFENIETYNYPIDKILITNDDKLLMTCGNDSYLRIFTIMEKSCVKSFLKYGAYCINSIVASPDSKFLYTSEVVNLNGYSYNSLKKYSLLNFEEEDFLPLINEKGIFEHLVLTDDGKFLYISESRGSIKKFSVLHNIANNFNANLNIKNCSFNMVED